MCACGLRFVSIETGGLRSRIGLFNFENQQTVNVLFTVLLLFRLALGLFQKGDLCVVVLHHLLFWCWSKGMSYIYLCTHVTVLHSTFFHSKMSSSCYPVGA